MREADTPVAAARWPAIVVVYVASVLQGLAMVSFPALGDVLKDALGLGNAQYGTIFLPQVTVAATAAIVGGALARRVGLKRLMVLSMAVSVLCQLLLAGSAAVDDPAAAYVVVLMGTASLGLSFGMFGAPLNSFPPLLFPRSKDASVVAIHSLFGVGLAAGPVIVGLFVAGGLWYGFPLALAACSAVLTLIAAATPLPRDDHVPDPTKAAAAGPTASPVFWLFVAIAMLYAVAEASFSNWAVIYLREGKGLDPEVAGAALSVFWGALVAGRLAVTLALVRVPATPFWLGLPVAMAAAFLLMPHAETGALGIAMFAFAGLACSAVFPLTITEVSRRFPDHVAFVSSAMIAALMLGIGTGSFALGALREAFAFEPLYRLSAAYPIALVVLAAVVLLAGRARRKAAAPAAE
jgi:fucose permease